MHKMSLFFLRMNYTTWKDIAIYGYDTFKDINEQYISVIENEKSYISRSSRQYKDSASAIHLHSENEVLALH